MQDSRWGWVNAEFNKSVLKCRAEIQSFAYVSPQEQNLRGYLLRYLVIDFETNSQAGSVTKEGSGILDITLESRVKVIGTYAVIWINTALYNISALCY